MGSAWVSGLLSDSAAISGKEQCNGDTSKRLIQHFNDALYVHFYALYVHFYADICCNLCVVMRIILIYDVNQMTKCSVIISAS